jgi:hypothetical protein
MENKRLIIWVYIAVTIIINYSLATEKQLNQGQNEQLKKVERRVSPRRREIEDSYMNRIVELRLRAASEIRLLEVAETSKPNWADIAEWADFAETVLQINGLKHESHDLFQVTTETSAQRLAVALSQIAKRKNDILSRSEWEAVNLENQKEYAFNEEVNGLEKILREDAHTPELKATYGLLCGIVYSPEKKSAVVNHKIVHEGDAIQGVSIIKIHKDKVEFEKNGNKWEQTVGQTPEIHWK